MDRRLVERAMHGDEEAFDQLVGRIGDSLYSVARRILRDGAGHPAGTARSRLHYALQSMRSAIEADARATQRGTA